jgi:putative ABC transport system ATP-binding protein
VLLLDEHTAALDPKIGESVMEWTCSIVGECKLTTVMVTHSMAQALQYGDRTLMFHRGQFVFDVSGDERRSMGVSDLLDLFKRDQGEELSDDALLLG